MSRKLASIQTIKDVRNIHGADLLQHYNVNGWWTFGKIDEFNVGDKIIF